MSRQRIDREKLKVAIQALSDERMIQMLEDAIDLIPPSKLATLIEGRFDPARLQPDAPEETGLLKDVKTFEHASLRGDYYEDFDVNSNNYTKLSNGTRTWIAEFNRLLGRCVTLAKKKSDPRGDCEAFEILFSLLRHIDEGMDDVVFFADEGGSWQVGVDWETVLPARFTCLAATVEPDEYAVQVITLVDEFGGFHREEYLASALKIAKAPQRRMLQEACQRSDKSR